MTSDGTCAANYISKLTNLYGDIAQCNSDIILNAVKICGSERLLYATDATINDGIDIYPYYLSRIQILKENLLRSDFENIMYKNAEELFGKGEI